MVQCSAVCQACIVSVVWSAVCQLTYWCNDSVQCASLYCVGQLECSVPVHASINMLYVMVVMVVMVQCSVPATIQPGTHLYRMVGCSICIMV